jgi:hypothetical protein
MQQGVQAEQTFKQHGGMWAKGMGKGGMQVKDKGEEPGVVAYQNPNLVTAI